LNQNFVRLPVGASKCSFAERNLVVKGSFPTEDAARKLITIQNVVPQWAKARGWTKALLALKIQFGDRLPD
jgi:hypothetical protein